MNELLYCKNSMNSTFGVDVVKYPSATPMNIIDKDVVGTKNASKTLY